MDEEDEHFLSASHQKCILISGTECHIINYLLTELARAIPGNIGPRSFLYRPRCARSVLSQPLANIPQYGPRARLVRGYYYLVRITRVRIRMQGKYEESNWLHRNIVSWMFFLCVYNGNIASFREGRTTQVIKQLDKVSKPSYILATPQHTLYISR